MKNFKFIFVLIFVIQSKTFACIHFPASHKQKITEGLQEFFVYHDGVKAHMILKTELSAKKFPKEIAWVLPFPVLPTQYQEVDGPLFLELARMFPRETDSAGWSNSLGVSKAKSIPRGAAIKVHSVVEVGDYTIQPIEILKEESGDELNQWLKKNKFNSMPEDKQKRYLKKGAAFLAIRMKMNQLDTAKLVSRPLHVTYFSKSISIPILFTHDDRTFDIDIYSFSRRELNPDFSGMYLEKKGVVEFKRSQQNPMVENLVGDQKGWITLYSGRDLNSSKKGW